MAAEPSCPSKAVVSSREEHSGRRMKSPTGRFMLHSRFIVVLALVFAFAFLQPAVLVAAQRQGRTCKLEDGRVLQPGEVMQQARACMVCVCDGDSGEVVCSRQTCPALDCGPEGVEPAQPSECCPKCRRK
uniref:VWFC domain-containing protein n=1 Tax=Mesocestoides corti TaxID=53468 RepID=A0A5K3F009_MESCO